MNLAARILKRAYDWASGSPRVPTWATQYAPARQVLAARRAVASGAAYHIANTPTAESIAAVWVTNAVGDGPSVRSGHPDEATRNALRGRLGRLSMTAPMAKVFAISAACWRGSCARPFHRARRWRTC